MSIPLNTVPIVTDPRKHLTRSEISNLQYADFWKMVRTRRGDWAGGGNIKRGKTMKPLITKQLLEEDYQHGRVTLRVTMAGRIALDTLNGK